MALAPRQQHLSKNDESGILKGKRRGRLQSSWCGGGGARGRGKTGRNQRERIEFCFCSHSENQSPPVRHFMTLSSERGGHQPGPRGLTVTYVSHVRGEYSKKPEYTFSDVIESRWQPCQERNHYTTVSWRFKNYSHPRSIFQLLINSNSRYYYCTLAASEWGNIPSRCCFGLCDCESWMFQICDKLASLPNDRFDHFECQLLMVLAC